MKVLMFGWEFPPHITGGLGTACFGLTKGLMKHDVEVLFVVPKAYGDENQEAVRLINASDISIDFRDSKYEEYWRRITYMEIGSNLIPYVGPEEFKRITEASELESSSSEDDILSKNFEFSGKYGTDLMDEVKRYALVASAVAADSLATIRLTISPASFSLMSSWARSRACLSISSVAGVRSTRCTRWARKLSGKS